MSALPPAPLAVSLGDPAGIGPELIVEAWAARLEQNLPPFAVVGGAMVLSAAAQRRGIECPIVSIRELGATVEAFARGLPVMGRMDGEYAPGIPDADGARLALSSLTQATELARQSIVGGVVTAPIAKSELAKVGFTFPGQTEFLADACGFAPDDAVMMLAGPSLKAIPVTVHCALAEVPSQLTTELILHKARIAHAALQRDFGLDQPRIAICGLNPHAGESGRMGNEERDIIAPAIAQLQQEGIAVSGPHPADTMFAPHAREAYDVALAMYHDQALVPLKALDFDQGVNVTLGLPFIRTSPDHGTAFDIAGKGEARPDSMIAAIRMAGECAARRGSNG